MNLTIRRTEPGDYEAVAKIFTYPRVTWGTLQLPYPSVDAWRKRLAEPPDGFYALVACVDGEVVGHIGLQVVKSVRRRHVGDIGMMVRDDWQCKGVGTALMQAAVDLADKWLNLRRLELEVYVDNAPAIKLYKKFGFEVEGRRVDESFRDGGYVDTFMMARMRK